jgi:hypothetical protein
MLTPAPALTLYVWVVDRWQGKVESRASDEHDELGWFRPEETDGLDLVAAFLKEVISDATAG